MSLINHTPTTPPVEPVESQTVQQEHQFIIQKHEFDSSVFEFVDETHAILLSKDIRPVDPATQQTEKTKQQQK